MGVQKVTFEGGNVTSKIDADLYHHLFSQDVGILMGLKNECGCTLANNTITFSDGYISVYGRIVYIENATTIGVTPDTSKYGYVVLGVNTSDNTTNIYLKELEGGYPSLTLTNILTTNGLYELVLCAYTKTTTSVTLNTSYSRKLIQNDKEKITELESDLVDRFLPQRKQLTKVSNGVYQFVATGSVDLSESIIYVAINNHSVVSFPGEAIFIFVGSNTNVSYRYGGADYSLGVVYESGIVTLTCGSSIHNVTSVFVKK